MGKLPTLDARDLYLDLLKKQLTGMLHEDPAIIGLNTAGYVTTPFVKDKRELGGDYPSQAHTMIGMRRLDNIQMCVEQLLADDVAGDLIETGVWRGGAVIFMRGLLAAYGIINRTVWVADSFQGLPAPDLERFPQDAGWVKSAQALQVSEAEVRRNFALYELLDEQVRFLPGWFSETLAAAPITQLALLRLDGDLYGSTWDALSALYHKVSPGGFIIIDDYSWPTCRQAVNDFRLQYGITEVIQPIDVHGVFWRRAYT